MIWINLVNEAIKKEKQRLSCLGTPMKHIMNIGDGIHILNPGSLGHPRGSLYPTYAVIDIQGKNIVCNHIRLEEQH